MKIAGKEGAGPRAAKAVWSARNIDPRPSWRRLKAGLRAAVLAVAGATLLVACGGGHAPDPTSEPLAQTRPDRRVLAAPVAPPLQRWSEPATWGGTLPVAGASVLIPAGQRVMLDGATPPLGVLTVEGELVADPTKDVAITAQAVHVKGGRLSIGTSAAPYLKRAVITLTGTSAADLPGLSGFGAKVLAQTGGRLELHGAPVARSWTRLEGGDVVPGATRLTLASAPGWKVGDRIVVATSTKDQMHHDVVQIAAIEGAVVQLVQGLRFGHFGAVRRVGERVIDVRAAVGLLSRNIVVQGDLNSEAMKLGGHAMFMAPAAGATVQIAGVEFTRMGQLNQVGRYPLHFHEMHDRCHHCYVRDSTVRDTLQRGIVLHDVSGVRVEHNVIFNTVGHNVVVESHQTTGNVIDQNLALVNRQPDPLHTQPVLVAQNDRLPANFWMRGSRNQVTRNVAAGSQSSGFNYDGINADPIHFEGNTAHAAMGESRKGEGEFDTHGGLLLLTEAARPETDRMVDFTTFHNAFGLWPEENGVSRIERFVAAENGVAIFGRGVGNKMHFKDGLIVGRLPGSRAAPGVPLHYTYGSDTLLENITFAGFPSLSFAAGDSTPTQSSLRWRQISFVGARPPIWLGDHIRFIADDDTLLPRGYYVNALAPWMVTSNCSKVVTNVSDPDISTYWHCPEIIDFTEVDIRSGGAAGYTSRINPFLVRSDGLRYRRAADDAGLGSGQHGTTVVVGQRLSYRVDRAASTAGWALRIPTETDNDTGVDTDPQQTVRVDFAVPLLAAPQAVYRGGARFDRPDRPRPEQAMRPAASWEDHEANPLTTYLWDRASGLLWVKATSRWVVVQP